MFSLEILADKTQDRTVAGNLLTLTGELQPGNSINSAPEIGITLQINDGTVEKHEDHDHVVPDTEIYFQLPLNGASTLAEQLNSLVNVARDDQTEQLIKALEFKTAQLACAKGAVGTIRIHKVSDSDRGNVIGFGFYTLEYLDDTADATLLHTVENIEMYLPFVEEEQYEWLRTLVGGNHVYTSTIKVEMDGFTLDQARASFSEQLRAVQEAAMGR